MKSERLALLTDGVPLFRYIEWAFPRAVFARTGGEITFMRALSIKQPFAEMIASGKKKKEFRTWSRNCFGDLLIVASKSMHEEADAYAGQYDPKRLVFGKAVCVVEFYKVTGDEDDYAWHFRHPRRVQPIDVRGSASLYHVEDSRIRFLDGTQPAPGVPAPARPAKMKTKRAKRPRQRLIEAFITGPVEEVQHSSAELKDDVVIVADPDRERRRRFAAVFSNAGFEVQECADGAVAWLEVQRSRPSMLVANAVLDRLTGVELLSRVRRSPELAEMEVYL